MKWSLILFVLFSLPSLADVSRDRVGTILDQMVRENVISPAEAEKAKLRNEKYESRSMVTTHHRSHFRCKPSSSFCWHPF